MTDSFIFIDTLNDARVTGWCLNGDGTGDPVKLTFFGDDRKIGEICADAYRDDLKSLKFHPTGNCGFHFTFPDGVDIKGYTRLVICALGSEQPLRQIPVEEIPHVEDAGLPNVFFMHIPKTAGTSFNMFASGLYPEDSMTIHLEEVGPDEYPLLGKNRSYLAGHLPLRVIREQFDVAKFDLVTLLRDPYGQLHSHINWVKRIGLDQEGGFFRRHHELFQGLAVELNNLDFSVHGDLESLTHILPKALVSLFDNNQTRHFLETDPTRVAESDFSIARKNLESFKLVGVTERYAQFTEAFCALYHLHYVAQKDRFNEMENARLFDYDDATVRSILRPLVEFDLILYEEVVARVR